MKKVVAVSVLLMLMLVPVFAEKPTLTVLDFKINNISENDMTSIITFLSGSLFNTDKYVVIDTAQRDTILAELEFSNSGCTDETCQLEIGMLLSAEYIVTGNIARVGSRYILSAKMIETETSATENIGRGVYKNLDELIDDMDDFAFRLAGSEGLEAGPAEAVAESELEAQPEAAPDTGGDVSGRQVAAWSTLGAGVIASGISAYLFYDGFSYKSSTVDPAYAAYKDETVSDYGELSGIEYYNNLWSVYTTVQDDFTGRITAAAIVGSCGLASLAASAILFLLPEKETEGADIALHFVPGRDAVTLAAEIRM